MATDLQDFSRTLFAAADQLWTNSALRPDQYAQPVLALRSTNYYPEPVWKEKVDALWAFIFARQQMRAQGAGVSR